MDGPIRGRDESPADATPPRQFSRGGRSETPLARTESPADGDSGLAPQISKPAPGKYVPVHLRNR